MNLNINFLNELAEALSADVVKELIYIFEKQYQQMTPELKERAQQGDYDTVKRLAHTMKSSCRNVGAIEMAGLYQNIERNPESMVADRLLDTIDLNYKIYLEAIESWDRLPDRR